MHNGKLKYPEREDFSYVLKLDILVNYNFCLGGFANLRSDRFPVCFQTLRGIPTERGHLKGWKEHQACTSSIPLE